jgi:hypothetical protein
LLPRATPDQRSPCQLIRKGAPFRIRSWADCSCARSAGDARPCAAGGGHRVGIAYAALDEFHQVFVPSRTASPHDVVVNGGVVVGALSHLGAHQTARVAGARIFIGAGLASAP